MQVGAPAAQLAKQRLAVHDLPGGAIFRNRIGGGAPFRPAFADLPGGVGVLRRVQAQRSGQSLGAAGGEDALDYAPCPSLSEFSINRVVIFLTLGLPIRVRGSPEEKQSISKSVEISAVPPMLMAGR